MAEEHRRLHELIVPPAEDHIIFANADASRDDYSRLYERHLQTTLKLAGEWEESFGEFEPLREADIHQMNLYEDAFSSRFLALARFKVRNKLNMVNTEVARRQLGEVTKKKQGFWSRFRRARVPSGESDAGGTESGSLTSSEREILIAEAEDACKVETVDLPTRWFFEFALGKMAVDLVDDRWSSEVSRQLMGLALKDANLVVEVGMDTDHRGQDSAQWKINLALSAFHAFHKTQALFTFCPPTEARWTANIGNIRPIDDAHDSAARLVIESILGEEMNLMRLTFTFAPVQIHMLRGFVAEILEFWRLPPEIAEAQAKRLAERAVELEDVQEALNFEELKDMSKQWLQANENQAKKVVQGVYQRIPDKIQIIMKIASPILHVPVEGYGIAMLSLGQLELLMPEPCTYSSMDLKVILDHTAVTAHSERGERFDMIQPVPIHVGVEYRSMEKENSVNIIVGVKEMLLSVSPQAMQILLCVPSACMGILYAKDAAQDAQKEAEKKAQEEKAAKEKAEAEKKAEEEKKRQEEAKEKSSAAKKDGAKVRFPPTAGRRNSDEDEEDDEPIGSLERGRFTSAAFEPMNSLTRTRSLTRATRLASEVIAENLDIDGENLIKAAERKIEQETRKNFKLQLGVGIEAIDMTLADSIMPVMRFRLELAPPGLQLYQQSIPYCMSVKIDSLMMEVDVLNPRNGYWEPLAERFHLGLQVERKPGIEDTRTTHITVSGHEPLLLNFTPTSVRRAGWIMPQFIKSITFSLPQDFGKGKEGDENALVDSVKYRVVNLSDEPFELKFKSRHKDNLVTTVRPTGSHWRQLDEWVLPHFSTAIAVRCYSTKGGMQWSEFLSLERVGAVTVPQSGYVAELRTPAPSHRLLLLATHLRVHNQSDLALQVRFHDSISHQVLPHSMPSLRCCDATLLGHQLPDYTVKSQFDDVANFTRPGVAQHSIELPPNGIVAVPASAVVRVNSDGETHQQTWLSVRPATLSVDFSKPLNAGPGVSQSTLRCHAVSSRDGNRTERGFAGDVNFICDSQTYVHALPIKTTLGTITLQPTLSMINALPIGTLSVRYAALLSAEVGRTQPKWRSVQVPRFTGLNIYNFTGGLDDGIALQAQLEPGAPWSQIVEFDRSGTQDAPEDEKEHTQTMDLRQTKEGAAAGVTAELFDGSSLRFSCANWFIDRSGTNLTMGILMEVHQNGASLPRELCITLLPADVMEDCCDLVLRDVNSERIVATRSVRMPPNWTVFPWRAPTAQLVFCIQTEDISLKDVLGASCQVMTLRPRVVLTNASTCDLEIRLSENNIIKLAVGESKDHHWLVKAGEECQLTTQIRFRPIRKPVCQWSGTVICGDGAAGSTPFALPTSDERAARGSLSVEVWSAEVAPVRGALSVTFREGSDFVAKNNSTQVRHMAIRPSGCDDSVASVVVPRGMEVPYGWMRPFHHHQRRGVEVVINHTRIPIEDVRRTMRRVVRSPRVVVVVNRLGTQTLLVVQDVDAASEGGSDAFGEGGTDVSSDGAALVQLDVKVSRIGISLVEEVPTPRELLHVHFELLRFQWAKKNSDVVQMQLAISEAQVDCQLPDRVDATTVDRRRESSIGLSLRQERPAVILANCGDGDRSFLHFIIKQGATSSRDTLVHRADLVLDMVDITIDDGWLDPLVQWLKQTRQQDSLANRGLRYQEIIETAGHSILEGYTAPQLPSIVQVDMLHIGDVNITVWANVKLKTIRFVPQYIRTALRAISLSNSFTLDGAALTMAPRTLPPHRGSLADFIRGLSSEYTINLIANAAWFLGKSSLLNLPRVPVTFGGSVVSYLTESAGVVVGEANSLMAQLTFDDEYIERQRQIRETKRISGVYDGMVEAGRSLAQGIEGIFDIWRKPVEGLQQGGIPGLMSGLGRGFAGSIVKPLTNTGQAVLDVGIGIVAQFTPDTTAVKRQRQRVVHRRPRLLFTQLGAIRPWSELEAEVLWQLGRRLTAGVEEIVPLTDAGPSRMVLLLTSSRLILAEVSTEHWDSEDASQYMPRGTLRSSTSSRGGVSLLPHGAPSRASGSGGQRLSGSSQAEERGRSGSSSSNGPGERTAFFMAMDDAASKIYTQVARKPLNAIALGFEDIQAQMGRAGQDDTSANPAMQHVLRVLPFDDLASVRTSGADECLLILEVRDNGRLEIPLSSAPFGIQTRKALADGFRSALESPNRLAQWDELHSALAVERRQQHGKRSNVRVSDRRAVDYGTGAGERILEVFEVERFSIPKSVWTTAGLPMDTELAFRWVDATGSRHPHLTSGLSAARCAEHEVPPCELDGLFRPMTNWTIDKGPFTDIDGWKYGLAWNSSTWDAKPGLFDSVRKRRWTRKYE
eukprot:TRINITY_DN1524_c1_g2_i1.p1 TRINITY_DN1524_c1_g2~~TRINITY_DN1524_c1_g2_i1.p1  ORF type:complete len:2559 (+),score=521.14 TRINITY_DN1524_c1_g2_i1:670-7677(+)